MAQAVVDSHASPSLGRFYKGQAKEHVSSDASFDSLFTTYHM